MKLSKKGAIVAQKGFSGCLKVCYTAPFYCNRRYFKKATS